jgi:lysophosphatidylcholine acyltransferase/lyso-PAF acetyltransferase
MKHEIMDGEDNTFHMLEDNNEEEEDGIPNPFFESPPSYEPLPYKFFKYTFVALVLFVPRIIFTFILVVIILALYKISCIGLDYSDVEKPVAYWRRMVLYPITFLVRLLFLGWGFYWITVHGEKITDSSVAPIVVCNHVGFLDPLIIGAQYFSSPISAIENLDYPIIGSLLLATRAILLDRADPDSKKKAKESIQKRARLSLGDNSYPQLLIFPEGITTNGSVLVAFKAGAFNPSVPVQPVCIKYPYKYQSLAWTKDGGDIYMKFLKMLLQFVNHCEIHYLPLYVPNEEEIANPILYANNVRNLMAKTLNVPVTDHSYEDVHLLLESERIGMVGATTNIVFSEMNKLFRLNLQEAQEMLGRFAQIETTVPGKLSFQEFADFFGLPHTPEIEYIFQLFDINNDGSIDFKEFLIGISSISLKQNHNNNTEKFVEYCFKLFDKDSTGTISKKRIPYHTFHTQHPQRENGTNI